jgi:hypothetical protein
MLIFLHSNIKNKPGNKCRSQSRSEILRRTSKVPFLIAENEARAQTHEKEFQHPHG